MSAGPKHYAEAEALCRTALDGMLRISLADGDPETIAAMHAANDPLLRLAQVHATLALTAATVSTGASYVGLGFPSEHWSEVLYASGADGVEWNAGEAKQT